MFQARGNAAAESLTSELGECIVTCVVSRIAACSGERVKSSTDERTRATGDLVAGALQATIRTEKYSGTQIDVCLQVRNSFNYSNLLVRDLIFHCIVFFSHQFLF